MTQPEINQEELYILYRKHHGNISVMARDESCPVTSRTTLIKYEREAKWQNRLDEEWTDLSTGGGAVQQLEHARADLFLAKKALVAMATKKAKTAKTIFELKAAWEMVRTELGMPSTISQNANLNADLTPTHQRPIEDIDREIAELVEIMEEPGPPAIDGANNKPSQV